MELKSICLMPATARCLPPDAINTAVMNLADEKLNQ